MNLNKTPVKQNNEEGVGFLFLLLRYLGIKLKGAFALMTCIILIVLLNSQNELSKRIKLSSQDAIFASYAIISNATYKLKHVPQHISSFISDYLPFSFSQHKYNELTRENLILKDKIQQMEIELSENQGLRDALNYQDKLDLETLLTTRIISKNTSHGNTLFAINAGYNHEIDEGDTILSGNALAGKVIETTPNSSVAVSITDSNSKISAITLPSRSKCLILGNGSSQNLGIFFLTKTDIPENDDLIITSGEGGIFPYGIPIANIKVHNDTVTAIPISNFDDLEFVNVVKSIDLKTAN